MPCSKPADAFQKLFSRPVLTIAAPPDRAGYQLPAGLLPAVPRRRGLCRSLFQVPGAGAGRGGGKLRAPARDAAFGLTVVGTRSHGDDPEGQGDTNEQAQDDDVRQHLEVLLEEILLVARHGEPGGGRLQGKPKAQRISHSAAPPAPRPPLAPGTYGHGGGLLATTGTAAMAAPRPPHRARPAPERPRTAQARRRRRRRGQGRAAGGPRPAFPPCRPATPPACSPGRPGGWCGTGAVRPRCRKTLREEPRVTAAPCRRPSRPLGPPFPRSPLVPAQGRVLSVQAVYPSTAARLRVQ